MLGGRRLEVRGEESDRGAAAAVDDRYRAMVDRLERSLAHDSRGYARRVVAAALLGYGFILFVIAALLGIVVAMGWALWTSRAGAAIEVKVAVVCAIVVVAILRALCVKLDPVDGRRVDRSEAPAVFALIDRLRAATGGPPIDDVLVNDEFNAAILQHPRFMVFGSRNTLLLGLPLMQALSEDELAAVIAHELGHFVGAHGRWSAFVYLVRQRWLQVSERLPQGWTAAVLRRFFRWYGPWFNAYSFALARAQEYEADRVAAAVVGADVAGAALVRVRLAAGDYGDRWGRVWDEAYDRDAPGAMPYRSACDAPPNAASDGSARLALELAEVTGVEDTHPSLGDRLRALGLAPRVPDAVGVSAAAALLGPLHHALADELDARWWAANGEWWQTLYAERQSDRAEMAAIAAAVAAGEAVPWERRRQHAELARVIDGAAAAVPLLRALVDERPGEPGVRYQLGEALLASGEETAAVAEFTAAADAWPSLAAPAARLMIVRLSLDDRAEELAVWHERLAVAEERDRRADAEFRAIEEGDALFSLTLSPDARAALKTALADVPYLKHLHAARRPLRLGDRDQIVFTFGVANGGSGQAVIDQLAALLAPYGDTLGFQVNRASTWLDRKLRGVEGGEVYRRR